MHPLILYVVIRQEQEAAQRRLRRERAVRPLRDAPGGRGERHAARRASRAAALTARLSRILARLRPRPA